MKRKNSLSALYTSLLVHFAIWTFISGCGKIAHHTAINSSSRSNTYHYNQEQNANQAFAEDATGASSQADAAAMITQDQIQAQSAVHIPGAAKYLPVILLAAGGIPITTADVVQNIFNRFDNVTKKGKEELDSVIIAIEHMPLLLATCAGLTIGIGATMIGGRMATKSNAKSWISPVAAAATGTIITTAAVTAAATIGWVPILFVASVGIGSIGVVGCKTLKATIGCIGKK